MFFKNLVFSLMLALATSFSNAAMADDRAAPPLTELEPYKNRSEWEINSGWRFEVHHICTAGEDKFGFWPGDAECEGFLRAVYREPPPEDPLLARLMEFKTPHTSDEVSVGGQWGDAGQLYDFMMKMKQPIAVVEGNPFLLKEFRERVAEDRRQSFAEAQAAVEDDRSELRKSILAATLGCLFLAVVLRFAYRWARRVLPSIGARARSVAGSGAGKARNALGELRDIHTRHVVRDESIRAATRSALDPTREERAELRLQIERALEAGNIELAKTLTSLLRKLEGDKPNA